MSAAFEFREHLCWGSNGIIEEYLERMAAAPAQTPADAALAGWLKARRESFFMGEVVVLDDILADRASAARFVALLEGATVELVAGDQLSEYGRQWVEQEIPALKASVTAWTSP